jgi:hypothetical protein
MVYGVPTSEKNNTISEKILMLVQNFLIVVQIFFSFPMNLRNF